MSSFFACSNDDDSNSISPSNGKESIDTLTSSAVIPYSYDMTSQSAIVYYKIDSKQISSVKAAYKGPETTEWKDVDVELKDSLAIVELKNLTTLESYSISFTVYNTKGQYYTNYFSFTYDYEVMKVTCFKQPFIVWNSLMENTKKALKDAGNMLEFEAIVHGEYYLTYQFNYKELKSEYIFSGEQRLKNVRITLDKDRVPMNELQRFITGGFGYLAYGNIHTNIDGNPQIAPLYRTPEGASYVTIYERNNNYVVDYMDVKDVDISKVLFR